MDENSPELDVTELREKRRPLWMSPLGVVDYAEFVGGGGDIYSDRLPPAWERHSGEELTDEEEAELGPPRIELSSS